MTRPPDDESRGIDPQRGRRAEPTPPPATRQFGPGEDPAELSAPMTGPTDQYGPIDPAPSQAYSESAFGAPGYGPPGQYPPPGDFGDHGGGSSGSRGRTVGLALAVVAALAVIAVVAYLIFSSTKGDDGGNDAGPAPTLPSSVAPPSSPSASPSSAERSEPTSTPTSVTPSDLVVYQLTGDGDVIALTYRSGGRPVVIPTKGSPWSLTTQVGGGQASITAVVVRGRVTCSILRDGELLNSSTSGIGPLECGATL